MEYLEIVLILIGVVPTTFFIGWGLVEYSKQRKQGKAGK